MANWKTVLDIKEEWKKSQSGEMQAFELAKVISDKLSELQERHQRWLGLDFELEDLIYSFNEYAEVQSSDLDEFDEIMEHLYDWADDDHICWIKTF